MPYTDPPHDFFIFYSHFLLDLLLFMAIYHGTATPMPCLLTMAIWRAPLQRAAAGDPILDEEDLRLLYVAELVEETVLPCHSPAAMMLKKKKDGK